MRTQTLLVVLVMALLCWGFLEPAHAQRRGQPVELPEGMGQELVQANCTQCHGLNMIHNSGFTADGWEAMIATMGRVPEAESKSVAKYLATPFPRATGAASHAGPRRHIDKDHGMDRSNPRAAAA